MINIGTTIQIGKTKKKKPKTEPSMNSAFLAFMPLSNVVGGERGSPLYWPG